MKTFDYSNVNLAYPKILKVIKKEGVDVSPRGLQTKELLACLTRITSPQQRVLTTYDRQTNIFFLVAEALWILNGDSSVDWITHYNSKLQEFVDEGYENFHGAYGTRIRKYNKDKSGFIIGNFTIDQLQDVYEKLKTDPTTRQAVITLWNPNFDNSKSKDIPCNNWASIKIREGKLHWHQATRSNDVNLGLFPTNFFQFSMIQSVLAGWLGIEEGELIFFSSSLHLYKDSKITERVLDNDIIFDVYDYCKEADVKLPKKEFDETLAAIIAEEKRLRKGQSRILFLDNTWWNDVITLLEVWNLRKQKKYAYALTRTFTIKVGQCRSVDFLEC